MLLVANLFYFDEGKNPCSLYFSAYIDKMKKHCKLEFSPTPPTHNVEECLKPPADLRTQRIPVTGNACPQGPPPLICTLWSPFFAYTYLIGCSPYKGCMQQHIALASM